MADKEFLKWLREEGQRQAELPWEEFIAPLVERGICDMEGNVLVCMPPPPRTVYDEDGNATIILPDLSQPPPPPIRRNKPKAKPRAKADAKAKPRRKKPGAGDA
jgi:hypothetical protein